MQDTITIKFRPEGDENLLSAIKSLDAATKSLVNSQAGLEKEGKKQIRSNSANQKAIKRINTQLAIQGSNWKKAGISAELYTKAVKGNAVALGKVRVATKKHIADLAKQRKGLLDSAHSSRILGGSFAVLRSKLLIASFAIATMIKPLTRLVKMAGDANETFNKTSVVFGKFSGAVKRWASDFGKSVGYSESTLLEFANTFQDTFVPLGFARVEAAKFSTSLTKLALDVASFSNKMDADVVRDFQSAIVGNHETVRKYGVVIDEAIMKAKAYEMGIAEVGEELTASQKVLARFQVIISGSADAMGDKARTMGDYNNQLKTFQELTKKTGEELGRSLMPVATVLLKLASHFANPTLIKSYTLAVGALTVAYLAASGAVKGFIVSLKSSKIAMASTGIGLAIVAFGEIAAAVMRAREEQIKYNKTLEDYQLLSLSELLKEQTKLQNDLFTVQNLVGKGNIHQIKQQGWQIKEETATREENTTLVEKQLALITQEITSRKIAAGIIDDSATALGALDEAYAKTIDGQKIALETQIKLIKAQIGGKKLTPAQVKGLEELEAQLRALTPNYQDWVAGLEKTNKENEQQAGWIEKLIRLNPDLAKAMGFVKDKGKELSDAEKNAQSALEATTIAQRTQIEATIAQLEADREGADNKDKYTEAIENQREKLKGLGAELATIKELQSSINAVYSDNMEFQLELINLQEQAYLQQELNKTDVAAWAEQQRTDIILSHLEKRNALYTSFMAGYDTFINSLTDMEMTGKERRERIWESTRAGFVKFLGELLKEKIKQMIAESIIQKGKQATDIAATTAQAQLAKLAWATPAYLASVATGGTAAITGLSSLMSNMALARVGVEAFAKGGEFVTNKPEMIMVGEAGREHVKITPIDRPPERALSGGSTIIFNNPIMTEDFTRDQIIPQIEKATRLNLA